MISDISIVIPIYNEQDNIIQLINYRVLEIPYATSDFELFDNGDRRPGQGTSASSSLVTAAQQMERRKPEDGRRGNNVEQQLSSTVLGSSFR